MFDPEKSITAWRQQMLAAGIKAPVPLEELEIHLREEIERQMKLGLDGHKAFKIAARQIGQPKFLKSEFQKTSALAVERKRIVVIAGSILTVFVGFIMLWAVVVQSRDVGKMNSETIALLGLGLVLVVDGAAISFLASKSSFLASKREA